MMARAWLAAFTWAVASASVVGAEANSAARPNDVFAVVGETKIQASEYDALWAMVQRQKFYHRKAPEAEVAQVRREVGDRMINQVLVTREVERRGIAPDDARVQAQLAEYRQRYGASPGWQKIQSERLPALTRELERQSAIERLSAQIRAVEPPDEATARAYFDAHPQLFTEPEQIRFSVILLKVDPSSPKTAWQGARQEAAAIHQRLKAGAEFADLARMHSSDASAERGGDMGYVHRGMLPDGLADRLATMRAGEVSEPVTVLEGVALLRLADRKVAQLRAFAQVRERAAQLWVREESERRWLQFLAGLRQAATVTVLDETRYPPVPAAPK